MNRVLLCGVCVGAVLSLLGEECTSVTLYTSSDSSTKQKTELDTCENGQALLHRDGIRYQAQAFFTEESGITLLDCTRFIEQSPGLVTLLMQNIARCLTNEGISIKFSVDQYDL